ncbi:MAG: hypothetical protein WDN26_02290 [Chitinophagaceae bacterium]
MNVPIGLIQSAWSGTPVELWEPNEVIDSEPGNERSRYQNKRRNVPPQQTRSYL